MSRQQIFQEIQELREIQINKLGYCPVHDDGHTISEFEGLVVEYLTEESTSIPRTRFLRAASIAIAAIESIDRQEGKDGSD